LIFVCLCIKKFIQAFVVKIKRTSRTFGGGMRLALRNSSNFDGEIPMYVAASKRERARLTIGRTREQA
jgi:hypothetical protein